MFCLFLPGTGSWGFHEAAFIEVGEGPNGARQACRLGVSVIAFVDADII